MKPDPKSVGKRIRLLREHCGLTQREFGILFHSKESSVYQWEKGRCIPMLEKLLNITGYFNVSMDCLLNGKSTGSNQMEALLCSITSDDTDSNASLPVRNASHLMQKFYSLSDPHRERLIGYLEALCLENR